jgi:hypothetical protein
MRFARGVWPLALAAALTVACGDPPEREIQQAQSAIDAARQAGADTYAHDEFAAAQASLKNANDAVTQRDYRLALSNALDARERALNAAKEAADRKAAARADAERFLTTATSALTEARMRLKAAETVHASPRALADARRAIAGVDQSLQKARAAQTHGDYIVANAAAQAAITRLQAVARDLDAASTPPRARRR